MVGSRPMKSKNNSASNDNAKCRWYIKAFTDQIPYSILLKGYAMIPNVMQFHVTLSCLDSSNILSHAN